MIDTRPQLRPAADSVAQDWGALARYLSGRGMTLHNQPAPAQFAGGLANLNYLLTIDGCEYVLRRPPPGELPPGAYDMAREFRILSGLSQGFPLAPGTLHCCEDAGVLGAPFQIIEFRRGFAVRGDSLPESLRQVPDISRRLSMVLVDTLVKLHQVDPLKVGLNELGRPQGFLERSVEGWIKRVHLAADPLLPTVPMLAQWLRSERVADGKATLIHNDLKLDNLLLDGTNLTPVAVLDWDQCTRGDPLFDLATTLSYWVEPGDPEGMQTLRQMPTARGGFLSRRQAAEAYAEATGADLSGFCFHRVLALFKLGGIFYQLHARYRSGATQDARYAGFGGVADCVMEFAAQVAQGKQF